MIAPANASWAEPKSVGLPTRVSVSGPDGTQTFASQNDTDSGSTAADKADANAQASYDDTVCFSRNCWRNAGPTQGLQSYHFTNGEEEQPDTGDAPSNDHAPAWSPFDIRVLPQTLLAGYLYYNRMKGPRTVDPNTYHRSLYADLSPGVPP